MDNKFFFDWPAKLGLLLKLYSKLLKVKYYNFPSEGSRPAIFIHWHDEDLSLLPLFGQYNPRILISKSKDGAILSRAVEAMGYDSSRGSSSKGGAAGLKSLVEAASLGQNVVFAADGPRGPRHVAKPGPVMVAAKSGLPIIGTASALSRSYIFKSSWNKTKLPLPGAQLMVAFSDPIYLGDEALQWPAHAQSRFLSSIIADTLQKAQKELETWGKGVA